MKYASREFAANGTAALALVTALIEHFQKDGTLIPKDKQDIVSAAIKLAPQGVGRTDAEAREVLASMLSE